MWGLVVVGLALVLLLTLGLGGLAVTRANGFERLLAGATLTLALVVVATWVLAAAGVLTPAALLAVLGAAAAAVVVAVQRRGTPWRLPLRAAVSALTVPLLLVAGIAVALSVVSAYYLPVWQWDALGYHLPFVNLVLQHGSLADVPADIPYLSTYPHVVEWAFAAWRSLLGDDRLVELGHLPFGLLGAAAIAAIAFRLGARPGLAVAAGAAWLTLPAVFLQLPTNYTDVASAALALTAIAFVLAPLDRSRVLLAGIAIGLFLGSKPQAPIGAVILLGTLTVLAWRAGQRVPALLCWLLVPALGAYSYLVNIFRQGNPVWPVAVDIGPLHLPGPTTMARLLGSGANTPHTHGNLASRVVESWTTLIPPLPVFDMRIGGFGLLFLIALPFAFVRAVQTRSLAVVLCFAATVATPDPSVARYVLAFAGLTLAFAVPALGRLGSSWRSVVLGVLAVVAASNLFIAYPGLTGEGPPLSAYPGMTQAERQRAVGADGDPSPYFDVLARLGADEVTVVDSGAELPYLAWPSDLSRSAVFVPANIDAAGAERIVTASGVRVLILGDDTPAGLAARAHPELFVPQFRCPSAPCTVYLRR